MSDHLSDVFRANVLSLMEARGLTMHQLGKRIGGHPTAARIQLTRRGGFALATVAKYADALDVPVTALLRPEDWCKRCGGAGLTDDGETCGHCAGYGERIGAWLERAGD